jgi:hypothetical protein
MRAYLFADFDELPDHYHSLFEAAGQEDFYFSLPWYRNLTKTTIDVNDTLILVGIESNDNAQSTARALIVLRKRATKTGFLQPRTLHLFENVYTMIAGPVIRPDEVDIETVMQTLASYLRHEFKKIDVIQLGSMDPDSTAYKVLETDLRQPGFMVQRIFSFINWYEPTAGITYASYFSSLTGQRSILRKQIKKLESAGIVRWKLVSKPNEIKSAMADYATVYRNSWKQTELYPDFIDGFVDACAQMDCLRIGVLYLDDQPAAAQIWTLTNGKATIYKIAYDEQFKSYSVGSVLTMRMMQHILDDDKAAIVDFGYGNDPYKKDWTRQQRDRMGLLIFNLRSVRGFFSAGKFILRKVAVAAKNRVRT